MASSYAFCLKRSPVAYAFRSLLELRKGSGLGEEGTGTGNCCTVAVQALIVPINADVHDNCTYQVAGHVDLLLHCPVTAYRASSHKCLKGKVDSEKNTGMQTLKAASHGNVVKHAKARARTVTSVPCTETQQMQRITLSSRKQPKNYFS